MNKKVALLESLVNVSFKDAGKDVIQLFKERKIARIDSAMKLIAMLKDGRTKSKAIKKINGYKETQSVKGRLSRPTKKTIEKNNRKKKFYIKYTKVIQTTYTKDKNQKVFKDKVRGSEVILARNEKEAKQQLMNVIMEEINDSGKSTSVTDVENINIISDDNIKSTNIKHTAMFQVSPIKYDFIPADFSLLKNENQCFIDQFLGRYQPIIKRLTYDKLISVAQSYHFSDAIDCFETVNWVPSCGFTPARINFICEQFDISCYAFDCQSKCFLKYVSKNSNYAPLVYFSHNQHMYLISDKKYIDMYIHKQAVKDSITSSIFAQKNDIVSVFDQLEIKEHNNKEITELINENDNCIFILPVNCLNDVLETIIQVYNYVPAIKNSKFNITYIHFNDNNKNIHLYSDPNELIHMNYKDIQALTDKLQMSFRNQSFGALIKEMRLKFFHGERVQFSSEERSEISTKQNNKCNVCHEVLKGGFHVDHIKPLSSGGNNDKINLQALCIPCHSDKTKKEVDNGAYVKMNETESSYNSKVMEVMNSEQSKTWAFIETMNDVPKTLTNNKVYHIDINKCRKNIMYHSKYEYPVFTVMDSVQVYKNQSGPGLYYIESNNYLPLRGNGWYYEPVADYCIKEGIIDVSDIKYVIIASLSVKGDYFNKFIEYCYDILGDYAKLSVNSMIGCFKTKDSEIWKSLCITADENEAFYYFLNKDGSFIHNMNINEKQFYQAYNKRIVRPQEFETPLYDMVLQMEIIELHKLSKLVMNNNGVVLDVNTDCVSCVFLDDKLPFAICNDKVNLSGFYFDDNMQVPKYKLEFKDRLTTGKKPNFIRSNDFVYTKPSWNITEDVENNDMSKIVDHIIDNKISCNVDGRAGCGKTTLIKAIMKKMSDNNMSYVSLAPTNKACRLINGKTIHKFAISYKRLQDVKKIKLDYIIVDEISMVSEIFYKFMITMKRLNKCNFIISGDFGQLLPVNDRRADYDYKNSAALNELCDGNRVQLSKCRRADAELFTMCLDANITKLTKADFNNNFTGRHICFTNKKRKEINAIMMNKVVQEKKIKCLKLTALENDTDSQDVKLIKGMPIIARVTNNKYEIMNNETFTIIKIDLINQSIIISDGEDTKEIPIDQFQYMFYVAFCITTHKSQGETYDHPYTIHEWEKMDRRLKYVALSRATKKEYINII